MKLEVLVVLVRLAYEGRDLVCLKRKGTYFFLYYSSQKKSHMPPPSAYGRFPSTYYLLTQAIPDVFVGESYSGTPPSARNRSVVAVDERNQLVCM